MLKYNRTTYNWVRTMEQFLLTDPELLEQKTKKEKTILGANNMAPMTRRIKL